MKVCFMGLGSIAARHIKNLHSLYGPDMEIDVVRSGKGKPADESLEKRIAHVYQKEDAIPGDYDVIFITNPTKLHYTTLKEMHDHGRHFFIEKPVFETGKEDIEKLGLRKDSIYYVACPLRYTNVIQYLKREIDFSQIYSMRCISSSYLPQWRPGVDYRNTYSAKRALGGGVAIDLIHEWDYICHLIGRPMKVSSLMGKKSDLEIDSDDVAVYIAEYGDKMVEVHLDYFGRVPVRKIELYGRSQVIEADLLEQKIIHRTTGECVDLSEDRDSYQKKELIHFFRVVNGEMPNDNTIQDGCRTLRIAGGGLE